jgi:hypothetical protein
MTFDSRRWWSSRVRFCMPSSPCNKEVMWIYWSFIIKDDFIPDSSTLRWWSSRVKFCIPSWPCSFVARGADTRKRAERAWCSWSTQRGEYKCDAGMSVENVSALSTGSLVGVVKSAEKKKSFAGQFAVKYKWETHWWTFLRKYKTEKITGYTRTGYFLLLYESEHCWDLKNTAFNWPILPAEICY